MVSHTPQAVCTILLIGWGCLAHPLQAGSLICFPRLSLQEGFITGAAIVNPSSEDAIVTMTAYGKGGEVLAVAEAISIPKGTQYSKLVSELFPELGPEAIGWFQAASEADGLTGFFLFLRSDFTLLDGADPPPSAPDIAFNQVRMDSGHRTEISIINPGELPAGLELTLHDGARQAVERIDLAPKGMCRLDAMERFGESGPGAWIQVSSAVPVAGVQFVFPSQGDVLALNARPLEERLDSLYFPQLAVLGGFEMELGLVNYSDSDTVAQVWAFDPDGVPFGPPHLIDANRNPRVLSLEKGESLRLDVENLFGFQGSGILSGWIKVESTSEALNGYVVYGDPVLGSSAAVPAAEPRSQQIFSHIATVEGFFTGLAILNQGSLTTDVRIVALDQQGVIKGKLDTVLQPGQRISKRLCELLGEDVDGLNGGLIWIKSSRKLHSTAIFGPLSGRSLANIPPQPSPESYRPDSGWPLLRVCPLFWTMEPGQTFGFQVEMEPFGSPCVRAAAPDYLWSVEGGAAFGSVSGQGDFTAPQAIPSPPVATLTLSHEDEQAKFGASIDILGRISLLTGLGPVQSVAYLDSLRRLYIAESSVLSPSASLPAQSGQGTLITEIILPLGQPVQLPVLNHEISDMIPFEDGQRSLLLLLSKSQGSILRLDPQSPFDVETAFPKAGSADLPLQQPEAMVFDPFTNQIWVAGQGGLRSIPLSSLSLNSGPQAKQSAEMPSAAALPGMRGRGQDGSGPSGVELDICTGKVYFSEPSLGSVVEFDPSSGSTATVAEGLSKPGQMAALHRSGADCRSSLHLLVVEEAAQRVSLIIPSEGLVVTPWIESGDIKDLAFLPGCNPPLDFAGVFVAEQNPDQSNSVFLVPTPGLYEDQPENLSTARGITLADANLEAAVREALGISEAAPITIKLARSLASLDASSRSITSLQGLESFTNLSSLDLGGNSISDLGPLAGLANLAILMLGENQISDIASLAGLTNLRQLSLLGNQISALGPFGRAEQPEGIDAV